MRKFLLGLVGVLSCGVLIANAAALSHYIPGFRTIDGSQLNLMVDAVNNLTGNGTPAPVTGTTGAFSGNVTVGGTGAITGNTTVGGTLGVTGVTTFTAVPVAPAGGVTLGATTFTEAALGLYTKGVAAGYKVARGETALDGTNPTPVTTGLATIVSCTLSIKATAAPGVSTSVVTYDTTTGTMNMYGWKVTGTGDTTLIASAGTDTIGWVCVGT